MRRFIRDVALFLVLQGVILGWVIFKGGTDSGDYLGASLDKRAHLLRSTPPRVVFVGGSSSAFSLDSAQLERKLGRKTINMGLHAGLGLEFILNEVPIAALGPGDLVVLNLEYEHFCFDELAASVDLLLEALQARPASVFSLDGRLAKELADNGLALPSLQLRRAISSLYDQARSITSHQQTLYRRDAFNQFGDAVAHWNLPAPVSARQQHIAAVEDLKFEGARLQVVTAKLNQFGARCAKRGATAVLVYPAYPDVLYARNRAVIDATHKYFKEHLQIPVLGSPIDSLAPLNVFFDTHYHLTKPGVDWRSTNMIRTLTVFLDHPQNDLRPSGSLRISQSTR